MERFRVSLEGDSLDDSRNESEILRLREEVKRSKATIEEKCKIISSLRQQVDDLQNDTEELETAEQLMRQKIDRFKKEINEKDETIEGISHAIKELEAANENLTKRYDARLSQITKYHDDLSKTKKELEEAKSRAEEYGNQNELLRVELEAARRPRRERVVDEQNIHDLKSQIENYCKENEKLKSFNAQLNQKNQQLSAEIEKKALLNQKNQQLLAEMEKVPESKNQCDQSYEGLMNELYNLRAQVKSLSHRQSRRSIDEEILKLRQELEVTETSWRLERQHKERYARENLQLDRKLNELTKEIAALKQQIELAYRSQPSDQHENKPDLTSAIHFSTADEVGEIMDQSSTLTSLHHCQHHHRIKKSQFLPTNDPIAEHKLRLERASELARRNMQTKPLHQTSYPLELDTFGPIGLTETDIKRGNVSRPALNASRIAQNISRPALNDTSNQRKPVKKAEAFVV